MEVESVAQLMFPADAKPGEGVKFKWTDTTKYLQVAGSKEMRQKVSELYDHHVYHGLHRKSRQGSMAQARMSALQGSGGQQLAALLMGGGFTPPQFLHCYAKGYLSGTYGSQSFHRHESGLEPGQVMEALGIAP